MKILYFAWVREQIGMDREDVEVPAEVIDIAGLITWLAGRGPSHAAAFREPQRIRAAIDNQLATPNSRIAEAAEIALFPPVTGG